MYKFRARMKKLASLAALVMILASCVPSSVIHGSGREARGAFDISLNYTALEVSSGIVVEFVRSESGEGFITADEEVLEYVSIVQNGGHVKVSYEPFVSVQSPVKTVVTMPLSDRLTRLDASSAARVTSARRLLCSSMEIDISSAAEVELDMDAQALTLEISSSASFAGNVAVQNLEVEMSSASKCNIEGSADYCEVEATSAAKFDGAGFVCRRVEADASSAAGIEISVTEELDGSASSGGSVRYKGSPAIVRQGQSSGGSVRQIN